MLELLFLLLPVAMAYGWYMGYRSVKKEQDEQTGKLTREYVTGVNYLLSNQHEKAVNLFLDIIQKEDEDEINDDSRFEAELTLGNLFRSRGEIDQALRIHKNLSENENYSYEQQLLAKQQLALDFIFVGIFDRAEALYLSLVDEPEYAENALEQLARIYQKTKEWQKAINVTEKCQIAFPKENNIKLANFYCEYSNLELERNDLKAAKKTIKKAIISASTSIRALMSLGDLAMTEGNYIDAIKCYRAILKIDNHFARDILPQIKACYVEMGKVEDFELFLIQCSENYKNPSIELALTKCIEEKDGIQAAQANLFVKFEKIKSMGMFYQIIEYQVDEAEEGRAKESLRKLQQIVGERMESGFGYRCTQCGYSSHKLLWCCPSCNNWETLKPNDLIN